MIFNDDTPPDANQLKTPEYNSPNNSNNSDTQSVRSTTTMATEQSQIAPPKQFKTFEKQYHCGYNSDI